MLHKFASRADLQAIQIENLKLDLNWVLYDSGICLRTPARNSTSLNLIHLVDIWLIRAPNLVL
jgi:hypothetical protein